MCNKVPQMCVSSGPTVVCLSPFLLSYLLTLENQNASTHQIEISLEQFHKLAAMNVIPAVLPPCSILPSCTLPGKILSASVLSPLHLLPSITVVRCLYRHLPTTLVLIIRSNYSKQRAAFTHIPFFANFASYWDENLSIWYDTIHLNSFIQLRMSKYVHL